MCIEVLELGVVDHFETGNSSALHCKVFVIGLMHVHVCMLNTGNAQLNSADAKACLPACLPTWLADAVLNACGAQWR